MDLAEAIFEVVRHLSPEKQREILVHARELQAGSPGESPSRRNVRGLWADLNIDLSAEDIDEARREIWKNFPRDEV